VQRLSLFLVLLATALGGYAAWAVATQPDPRPDADLAVLEARVASLESMIQIGVPESPPSEDQVAWWRRIEDEVKSRRTREELLGGRFQKDFQRAITESKAELTPEQRAVVTQLDTDYVRTVLDLTLTPAARDKADPKAAVERRNALFGEFETHVRAAIPGPEADKLFETLRSGRNRGFYGGTVKVSGGAMD
jgi:hypothetical protein